MKEQAVPEINKVFRQCALVPISHDDQDRKHRAPLVKDIVSKLFIEQIEPADCNAKFADVWRIENVWGTLRDKLSGKLFDTVLQ